METPTSSGSMTLAEVNTRLKGMGMPIIRPEQMGVIQAHARREDIIRACEQPNNPNARAFLERVLLKAGITGEPSTEPPEAAPEAPARPDDGQPLTNGDRISFHVYGGKAALCFEVDKTRSGVPTIALDAAQAVGAKQYNWGEKIRLQMTRSELPIVTAVLLGTIPKCEFKNHGQDNSKGFSMERQAGGKVFVKVFAKGESVKAVPIEAPDLFFVTSLFILQLQKACPWLDSTGITALVRATQQKAGGDA